MKPNIKTLLILDLDETLIHATEEKLESDHEFIFDKYYIYKRPYLNLFLEHLSNSFRIGIWSSADDLYVSKIIDFIKPNGINFDFIWGKSKCTLSKNHLLDEYVFEKRLKKLKKKGYTLSKTIIVDDSPEKVKENYGNAVYIKPFEGDINDNELNKLKNYLLTISNVKDVRTIEKRGWDKILL